MKFVYHYEDIREIPKSWKSKSDSWENNVKVEKPIDAQKFTLKLFADRGIQYLDFLTHISIDICEPPHSSYFVFY